MNIDWKTVWLFSIAIWTGGIAMHLAVISDTLSIIAARMAQ